MKTAVIMNTSPHCDRGGCQYQQACMVYSDADQLQRKMTTMVKGSRMGMALWCEYGEGHPFSEKKDYSTLQRKVTKTNKFDEKITETEEIVICEDCLGKMYGSPATSGNQAIGGVSDAVPYQTRDQFNQSIQEQNQDQGWRPSI